MKNLYNSYILPRITHAVCSLGPTTKQRQKIVPYATGKVLEIGSGSGLNFGFYNPEKVDHLIALEPSPRLMAMAKDNATTTTLDISYIEGFAESIPLEDNVVDSIVITYTLCSIVEYELAFLEMHRVLKKGGRIFFCEHGIAPDANVRRWQNIINPVWKTFGGGCNLNRNIPEMINTGPFTIEQIKTMYIPGFKPASFNYWGMAKPA